jgi:hypothetical protein
LINARQRARLALAARAAGKQWHEIAADLGYASEAGARLAATRLLKRADQESVGHYKTLNRQRFERMLAACWPEVELGNLDAIAEARPIVAELCKVDGSYAPAKVAPTSPDGESEYSGLSDAELSRDLAAALAAACESLATGATLPVEPQCAA